MAGKKVSIGKCEVIPLTDTPMQFPWQVFFPNIPAEELEGYRELYPDCWGPVGFATDAGAYAVRTAEKTVLVDTGIGPGPIQMLGGIEGKLLHDMNVAGVPPESVDIVLHTHLHVDHVGWNISPSNVPNFPNAKYYVPAADLEFFSQNLDANPHMQQILPLKEWGRLETFTGETPITPEVTTMPTPGHTPGHSSVLVRSAGEDLLIAGDVAHHPAQLDRTDWSPAFDVDPNTSAETRKRVAEELESRGHLAAFCHFPGDGIGRLVRKDGRRVFVVGG